MKPTNYGGRYATNFIEDIKFPKQPWVVSDERSGLTNYRPFEELGRSLTAKRKLPNKLQHHIDVTYRASSTPIGVSRLQPAGFGYTYVPPLGVNDFDWRENKSDFAAAVSAALASGHNYSVALVRRISNGIRSISSRAWILVTSAISAIGSAVAFRRKYTVNKGLQTAPQSRITSSILVVAVVVLAVCAGILAWALLHDSSSLAGNAHGRRPTSSLSTNPDGSSTSSSSAKSKSGSTKQNPANLAGNSATPSASDFKNIGSTAVSASQSLQTASQSSPSAINASTPTTSPNIANYVPYAPITGPSSSITSDGKQILGISSPTVTLN